MHASRRRTLITHSTQKRRQWRQCPYLGADRSCDSEVKLRRIGRRRWCLPFWPPGFQRSPLGWKISASQHFASKSTSQPCLTPSSQVSRIPDPLVSWDTFQNVHNLFITIGASQKGGGSLISCAWVEAILGGLACARESSRFAALARFQPWRSQRDQTGAFRRRLFYAARSFAERTVESNRLGKTVGQNFVRPLERPVVVGVFAGDDGARPHSARCRARAVCPCHLTIRSSVFPLHPGAFQPPLALYNSLQL